jgi:pyruvate/2-oxoacid:ferredoxin oxidoreductase alpha subunit
MERVKLRRLLTGNDAAAEAVRLSRVQVIAAYPITPQTSIAESLSDFVSKKKLDARYMRVESETSALACLIGASMAGARAFTATSSQGLALMHELLHWASGARLPIVLINVNRSMAAPWSLGTDHIDSLSQRDTGWLQFYCEKAQEVLDTVIIAFRLAETVLLPVMILSDGFYLSHFVEPVELPNQKQVDRFLPRRKTRYRLNPRDPHTFGGGVSGLIFAKLKRDMQKRMEEAKGIFQSLSEEFESIFGRAYSPIEPYLIEDAEIVLVTIGTITGTARAFVNQARKGGNKVGLLKMKMFRPFPEEEARQALRGSKRVVVLDRNISLGSEGIFSQELKAALYGMEPRPEVIDVISGFGGLDVTPEGLADLCQKIIRGDIKPGKPYWMGVEG